LMWILIWKWCEIANSFRRKSDSLLVQLHACMSLGPEFLSPFWGRMQFSPSGAVSGNG
jgi:hypothetical protein